MQTGLESNQLVHPVFRLEGDGRQAGAATACKPARPPLRSTPVAGKEGDLRIVPVPLSDEHHRAFPKEQWLRKFLRREVSFVSGRTPSCRRAPFEKAHLHEKDRKPPIFISKLCIIRMNLNYHNLL